MRVGQNSNKNRTDLLALHFTGDTPMIVDIFRIAR